ncbi:hypothetical protein VP01_11809g1 [Puccinia sorghi]|uniref:Uncharacterized protein n=1 Tax=Puccinia sorghi TaxID=27349 RepID=A0A0L6VR07_9BASI|nr:hypothetical protein VP01_11809g1 [Puccinia sorghi]
MSHTINPNQPHLNSSNPPNRGVGQQSMPPPPLPGLRSTS